MVRYSYWGGDTAQNWSRLLGGATAYLGGATAYLGGATAYLLAGWSNDYSANPGSILQAETCKILS